MELELEKLVEQDNPERLGTDTGETAAPPAAETVPEETAPENIPYGRFQEVVKERNETRESLEEQKRQIELLTSELLKSRQPVQQQVQPVQVEIPKEPNPDDYKDGAYDREYQKDIANFVYKTNKLRDEQENQKNATVEAHRRNFQQHQARAAIFVSQAPDYYTVAESNPITNHYPDEMKAAIVASTKSPEIAYYLGKNQAEAIRIVNSPLPALEIGKLEAKLSTPQSQKKVSMAPAPITPVGNTNAANEKVVGKDKMTYEEHKAKMNHIESEKRRNGTWGR